MLYGDSGAGKSSLINAGLLHEAERLGFSPERVRVQPRDGEELVVERIAVGDEGADCLPSPLAPDEDDTARVVLSVQAFEERARAACDGHRPLIIFDQFEEIVTLFEELGAEEAQRRIVVLLVALLREPLPIKILFAFREDYLGKVKQLLAACPELVDQALRLAAPTADALPAIIRGPFERYPGHFDREIGPDFAERVRTALAKRFGAGDLSLSEVQTVCLRLWQSSEPEALLAHRGVQGLLEDYLGEALDAFPPDLRGAAIALLGQMVTSAGTRNVMSAEDLVSRVREEEDIPAPLLEDALDRLESESRLVRRERRRDLYLYEVTSEFLLPWISRRRDEFRRVQVRRRYMRRLRILGAVAGALLVVIAGVVVLAAWALRQDSHARREATAATSLGLAGSSETLVGDRPDVSLLLALAANHRSPDVEERGAMVSALGPSLSSGAIGILRGHTGAVVSVAFSPNGRTLATASDDATARLWDVTTHRPLGIPLTGHDGAVYDVAFSPDGRTLATAGDDKTIRLWSARTGRPLGQPLRGHRKAVDSVAFSPDGRTLASASADKTIRLWNARTGRPLGQPLRGHRKAVEDVAFSPDGRTLASAGDDNIVRLWNARARRPRSRLVTSHAIPSVAFSPDGRTLAAPSSDDPTTVGLWDLRARRQVGAPLTGHTDSVLSVAFSPDGHTIASAGYDETPRLWAVRQRRPVGQPLTGHGKAVYSVAFGPDGRTLASAGDDKTIRLWNARTGRPLGQPLRGHRKAVEDVALSPNGRILASASDDKTIRLWNLRTHQPLGQPLRGHRKAVDSVAFSPDGRTLASASDDKTIRLWNLRTHQPLGRPLTGHKRAVYDVAFSPNGRTLASASADKTIRLWNLRTHQPLGRPLTGHTDAVDSVAFGPSGRTLASASADQTIRLWNLRTHQPLGRPLTGHTDAVNSVAFSPDERTLASAGIDNKVRLWDVSTHRPLGQALAGHTGAVYSVAFSPDGRTLASASEDKTIRLWKGILWRDFTELHNTVCSLVSAGLSRSEWEQYAPPGASYEQTCR